MRERRFTSARAADSPPWPGMIDSSRIQLVEASFDDPIVTGLHVEQAAELAARFGTEADRPGAAEPGMAFLVAREPAGSIGCAGLRWIGAQAAEVRHIHIRREYRGLGVTRLLLRGVEDLAGRRGCRIARLKATDLRDAGLYEAGGYVRIPPFGSHPARILYFEKRLRAEAGR